MKTAEYWIEKLGLKPHPEGGHYKETYRAKTLIKADALPPVYDGSRPYATAIIFLLKNSEFSAFHRLKSDEIWIFNSGAALDLYLLSDTDGMQTVKLGTDPEDGHVIQYSITAGTWIAAQVNDPGAFSLVSCFVSPGFIFDDFELADAETLISEYPENLELIRRFTKKGNGA